MFFIRKNSYRITTVIGIFLLSFCLFSFKVSASEKSIMDIKQAYNAGASDIASLIKEECVNELYGIKSLKLNIANSEVHYHCPRCGGPSSATTATVTILGYTKNDEREEELEKYTVSGSDGKMPRTATYQYVLTDEIKEKYAYLKVVASFTGTDAGRCGCNEKNSGHYSNGEGYAKVVADMYDSPIILVNGDLSNKSLIEGVSDYIGEVSAFFPGGAEEYEWQYYDAGSWKSLVNGTSEYVTNGFGRLQFSDKKGSADFKNSNAIKLINPHIAANGIKIRVKLKSATGADDSISKEATVTIKSRDILGIQSILFSGKYGEVGEKIKPEDILTFVTFNNNQTVLMNQISGLDSRVKYYGFIDVGAGYSDKTDDYILNGLKNNSITYSQVGINSETLKIKAGSNRFFVKITYQGTQETSVFGVVSLEGKDDIPPVFDENVMLYENDGVTLFTGKDFEISDKDTLRKLRIIGDVTDSGTNSEISWAYTLSDTKQKKDEVSIPVFKRGNHIDITARVNGTYTLMAEDSSGNKTSKIIKVNAYDENDPTLNVIVKGNGTGSAHSGYKIEAVGEDVEKLASKAYLYKRFDSLKEAESYGILSALDSEYLSENVKNISQKGFYLVAVRDNVGKIATQIVEVPPLGEVLDTLKPEIFVSPVSIKDLAGEVSEWNIQIIDNNCIDSYSIKDESGKVIMSETHQHGNRCTDGNCCLDYHFVPENVGRYLVTAKDKAGNYSSVYITATIRSIVAIEITGLTDTMSVNSEISMERLISGNRVLLKMNDGTTDIYAKTSKNLLECKDGNGKITDKIIIGYSENPLTFILTVNRGLANEKIYEYTKTIIGEDNVAPLPGRLETEYTDGWDGSLTKDLEKQVTLSAVDFTDDGSAKEKLIITWYKGDTEIQKRPVSDKGDIFGPFSGEEYNDTYRYTVTDENGNFCNSVSSKIIDCWDTTPPGGEIKLMPEGVTEDSKARYKQIQIINAVDNRSLCEKPFSFKGDVESYYGITNSVVAGENSEYDIYIKDSVGNVTSLGTVSLCGIDSVAPTINSFDMTNTDDGKINLHVDATDTDSAGTDKTALLKYSLDGENYQDSPDFSVSESGVYTIYVKDDTGNVTKTYTDYADTDKPVVSVRQDESGAGVIIVEASDNIGLSKIIMEGPDGIREILQVYDGALEDVVTKDIGKTGKYKIIATDMAKNSAETEIDISSIKTACNPSVLSGLSLTPQEWTSGDVTVIAQLTDTNNLSSNPFRWNGSIMTARPYAIVTENGKVDVEIYDRYGNMVTKDSVMVSNIDRNSPTIGELKQSEDKNHLIINVSDEGSGIAQITISGGPYTVETGAVTLNGEKNPEEILITLPTNGTYTIRAYDIAGNSNQRQITVSGVTTDIPKVEVREVVVTEEKVVTKEVVKTETVNVPVPVVVPVPTPEYITKYKYLKEKGEDTTTLIKGETEYISKTDTINENTTEVVEKVNSEISESGKLEFGAAGEMTEDGTFIGPDGYEYFNRIDPNLKNSHPFKYWFMKNAATIATIACILAIIFLIICIIMGAMLIRDYFSENKDKQMIKRISKK